VAWSLPLRNAPRDRPPEGGFSFGPRSSPDGGRIMLLIIVITNQAAVLAIAVQPNAID
jgi:hypothetical protein